MISYPSLPRDGSLLKQPNSGDITASIYYKSCFYVDIYISIKMNLGHLRGRCHRLWSLFDCRTSLIRLLICLGGVTHVPSTQKIVEIAKKNGKIEHTIFGDLRSLINYIPLQKILTNAVLKISKVGKQFFCCL